MKRFFKIQLCISFGLAIFMFPVLSVSASAAPAQLLNKTVLVSFSVAIPSKGSDGSVMNNPRSIQRTIYISSQGRVFVRSARAVGRNRDSQERGPAENSMRFAGNSLVGVVQFISGASQMTISFDPSFASCAANVLTGADGGKAIKFKGLDGIEYTATGKPQVSGVSCSIRDGNALAD